MLRPAGVGELDTDGPPVVRVAPTDDETVLLEPVDVPRQRRPLDVERPRQVVLRPPRGALQVREDEPHRHRATDLRERVVEGTADVLGRVGELKADRCSDWTHVAIIAF